MSVSRYARALRLLLPGTALSITLGCAGGSDDAAPVRLDIKDANSDQAAADMVRACSKETRAYYESESARGRHEDARARMASTTTLLSLSDRESAARLAAESADRVARGRLPEDSRLEAEWSACVARRRILQWDERAIAYSPLESLEGRWRLSINCSADHLGVTFDGADVTQDPDEPQRDSLLITMKRDRNGVLWISGAYRDKDDGTPRLISGFAAPRESYYDGGGALGSSSCHVQVWKRGAFS